MANNVEDDQIPHPAGSDLSLQCLLRPVIFFIKVNMIFLFVGLDHNREMVYEHCKKLLENLMLLAANQDHPEVARLLLSYQTNLDDTLEMISEVKDTSPNETGRYIYLKIIPI